MLSIELHLLLLILVANGAPIIATAVCGAWGARPLDGGRVLADGHRLLGDAKTWRGVLLAPLATGLAAVLLGLPARVGAVIGLAAMLGDLVSSFVKRRLGMASSSMAFGLDQIPEALLPLLILAVSDQLDLTGSAMAWIVAGFILLELVLSRLLYWLGIRKRPY
ncbi:MAG: CDP-archaeol synthase [Candidatus Competibacteraceae bacterium]|nr:CDP-archaeol synthase [Candidatus Competibacteraceae bacterium]